MSPQPHVAAGTLIDDRLHETATDSVPTKIGVYGELGNRPCDLICGIEVRVSDELCGVIRVRSVPRQQVARAHISTAPDVQQYVLIQGPNTLGVGDLIDQVKHCVYVIMLEVGDVVEPAFVAGHGHSRDAPVGVST